MANEAEAQASLGFDPGLDCFVLLLRFHGIATDKEQLRHRLAGQACGFSEMLRLSKDYSLKSRLISSQWARLEKTALPAIAERKDGSFFILGKLSPSGVLIQDPAIGRPQELSKDEFEAQWTGRLLLVAKRASFGDLTRRFDIGWFAQAMYKYRRLLVEVIAASFFLQIFALITPLFFQVVIDKVLVHRGLTTLDVLVIGLLTLSFFESVLTMLRTYVFTHTTNRIDVELGARLFKHLLALPIAYFEARRTGDSVARVRELENIRNFLTSSALTLIVDLVFTVIFLAVMFYYSPLLTGIVIASLPLYVIVSVSLAPLFRRRLDEKFERGAENQAFLVESLNGIETLKAMAIEPQMQRRWEEQLAGYVGSSFRVLSLSNWGSQSVQFISKLVTAGVLYFGAKAVIDGHMTVGELVAFNMLSSRVAQPVLRLAQLWQDFHQARLSVQRLGDILNTVPEPLNLPGRASLPSLKGTIQFQDVSFRYRPDAQPVLHHIDLDIGAGQVIGIVGPSGSGKSTLTKLVQRFHVPETGRILVDGIDIGMVDVSWLRRQIGIVLQENVLFNRSIRENIALADPGWPFERVVTAAKLAGAHDFIVDLPNGYDTMVGERGSSLSGGQRQRIAIARALISDPRILIFDEATSALDYESERVIQENMRNIAKGRTVLIIAHRLSTVRRADRIITLDKGHLVEDGSHDDLVKTDGRYASLYKLQAGLHEVS